MPRATTFLWNRQLILQLNCRGFVTAQHAQPEPSKYSHGPALEARTFMQPELPYYAHHPGRFVYIKDELDRGLYSIPHEPVRRPTESFCFSASDSEAWWENRERGLITQWRVRLPPQDAVELWQLDVRNAGPRVRRIQLYPMFSIGYMSWMSQAAAYDRALGGILARSVTPYQQLEDYARIRQLKDMTVLLHDTAPDAWEASREAFEGEGGIGAPDGVQADRLVNGDAVYESPIAVLQYQRTLAPGETLTLRFLFGPVADAAEARTLGQRHLGRARPPSPTAPATAQRGVRLDTPHGELDNFVNHWLARQVRYHGEMHRFTTDPQTRNYLQDAMGMSFLAPRQAAEAIKRTLSQQLADGNLPAGITMSRNAELKYINRVPHTDYCVWLPFTLRAYLDESGDTELLSTSIEDSSGRSATVFDRVTMAMRWLVDNCDHRDLSLIAQGDWCDPMNMVGPRGIGVSGWLSMATVAALREWGQVAVEQGDDALARSLRNHADRTARAVQKYLWDGEWFARGITDQGRTFGTAQDEEGRIFLNAQSWAILADIATASQAAQIIEATRRELSTPFGMMMLAPAYTRMHEDIGRVTQKHPGTAENGSIYNHAAAFFIRALFRIGRSDLAYGELLKMLPSTGDASQRQQLPVFVPNYYRGAVEQHPRTAGRSSQLFHTGAASWLYRILIEDLFGLRGCAGGLRIAPSLPKTWQQARIERPFRGATVIVHYQRHDEVTHPEIITEEGILPSESLLRVRPGHRHQVQVKLPPAHG